MARVAALLAAAAGLASAAPASAEPYFGPPPKFFEIAPYGGMFWSSQVNTSAGSLVFGVAPEAGVALDFQVDGKSQVEILYVYARPQAHFSSLSSFYASSPSFGVTTQYLQLGGLTTFQQGRLEPYLAGGLGVVWYSPSDVEVQGAQTIQPVDTWLFAFNLGLGVKWYLSDSIGLRAGVRFFLPVYFNSGTFISGPNGAALTVNAGVPMVQGDLTLGLVIAP